MVVPINPLNKDVCVGLGERAKACAKHQDYAVRTIAIVNQKGGCGKTTTAINLAAIYAKRGLRTLLVDMDPQSHCAAGLGVPEERIEYSIGDALLADHEKTFDPEQLRWEVTRNLDLAPSTMRLAALEAPGGGLHGLKDKDRRLESLLRCVSDRYDLCLIDCAPTIGLLTFNAMRAARETLIPVETGYFALKGAEKQWKTIQRMIEHIGRPIACHMLATMFDPESQVAKNILATLRRRFAGQLLPGVIRLSETIREATCLGQPVIDYAPESGARDDFVELADWLESHASRSNLQFEIAGGSGGFGGQGYVRPFYGGSGFTTGRPMTVPGRSGPTTDRASELVQRVQDIARRRQEKDRQLDQKYRVSVQDHPDPVRSALVASPLKSAPVVSPSPVSPAPIAVASSSDKVKVSTEARLAPKVVDISSSSEVIRKQVIHIPASKLLPQAASFPKPLEEMPSVEFSSRCQLKTEVNYGIKLTREGVVFVQPADCGKHVAVAGDFNSWSPSKTPMRINEKSGNWQVVVEVPPGKYQYCLVIDGQWQADRYNDKQHVNDYGEPNSVIEVMTTWDET